MNYDPMTPIWLQVVTLLKQQIVTGQLSPGEKLPGGRDLALRYEINPNTAARVYQALERGGLCQTRRGMGTYVTEDETVISALRDDMARDTVRRFLKDLSGLGLSRADAVRLINGEEEKHAEE